MSRTLQLTEQLISLPSVTPEDAGCLELLADALTPMGFTCERLDSGPADFRVQNLWAKRSPTQNQSTQDAISSDRPVLVFAGHTDVVPPGRSRNGPARLSCPCTATASSTAVVPAI